MVANLGFTSLFDVEKLVMNLCPAY